MIELVERVAKAIFDAENGIDGDQIGDMLYNISQDGVLYEDLRIVGEKDEAIARTMDVCQLAAAAAIDAHKAALADAGFVIVPREPTEAMVNAAARFTGVSPGMAASGWRAMVATALGSERGAEK